MSLKALDNGIMSTIRELKVKDPLQEMNLSNVQPVSCLDSVGLSSLSCKICRSFNL